jgi:hypothetical protein
MIAVEEMKSSWHLMTSETVIPCSVNREIEKLIQIVNCNDWPAKLDQGRLYHPELALYDALHDAMGRNSRIRASS